MTFSFGDRVTILRPGKLFLKRGMISMVTPHEPHEYQVYINESDSYCGNFKESELGYQKPVRFKGLDVEL